MVIASVAHAIINDVGLIASLRKSLLPLLPSAHKFFPQGQWWWLQDNAPAHTAQVVQDWMNTKGVPQLDFPPYSPDFNPIENLWSDLKRRVERRNPRTVEELEQYVTEEWANTPLETLQHLSNSMVDRCKAVIKQKGHMSKY